MACTLHGVRYANAETADTHRWAIVLHGYRGDHTGVLNLAMPITRPAIR